MKELEKFLNFNLVKVGFSLLLMVMVLVNAYYLIEINKCDQINSELNKETKDLSREIEQLGNKESYQNSKLYNDKETKLLNYKIKGEDVIDLSTLEGSPSNPKKDYIPEAKNPEKSKLENWIQFIFSGQTVSRNSNYCS